jgi:hypothetical protein
MHSLQQQLAWTTDRLQMTGFLITSILLFLMGAGCLALWWNARSHKAFGTLGLFLLAISGVFFADYLESRPWNDFLTVLTSILFIEVTADCLRIEKRRWIVPVRLLGAAALVVSWIPALSWTFHLPIELSKVLGPVLLIVRLRHPLPQHRFILRAIIPAIAIVAFFRLRLNSHYPGLSWLPFYFTVGGWRWYYGPLATVLFGAVTIAVFVRELIEDQREKERLTTELEAGRTMQQVLLGSEMPVMPDLRIQSVYRPAGQVGGDFFIVLPASGGILIALGDVSGKGLRAAMTVSSILGALRAISITHPAEILTTLNRTLVGRLQGGFVTCLCGLIVPDGSLTLANAGHLAPYRNGQELQLDSSLPLGIAPEADYQECTMHLTPGDQLTLLTDGVLEATSPTGELFGFDRTAAISTQSAEAIAAAAQAFGQDDDITVLTLTFAPIEVARA